MKTRQKKISLAVKAALIVPIGLAALTPNLGSATDYSANSAGGAWNFAAQWTPSGNPINPADTALINRSGGTTIFMNNLSRSISTLTVGTTNAGNQLKIGNTAANVASSVSASNGIDVGAFGSILVGNAAVTAAGTLSSGAGLTNAGSIVNSAVGVVTVAGNLINSGSYTSSGAGSLHVGGTTNNTGGAQQHWGIHLDGCGRQWRVWLFDQ